MEILVVVLSTLGSIQSVVPLAFSIFSGCLTALGALIALFRAIKKFIKATAIEALGDFSKKIEKLDSISGFINDTNEDIRDIKLDINATKEEMRDLRRDIIDSRRRRYSEHE